jgi:hypothetical protein
MRNVDGSGAAGLTRRGLLRAAGLGAATAVAGGCGYLGSGPQWRPGVDPLYGLREATAALADRYDATIARHAALASRLGPLRDAHRAHVEALERQLITTRAPVATSAPSGPAAVPDDPAAAVSGLLAAEKAGVAAASAACLAAPGWRAALLGSITAARASHVEVLS